MLRFGTKALLIGFAVAAVWLSTFGGYTGAADVRKSILLLIVVTSGFAAVYSRGRRRAFWAAFVVVMLVCGGVPFERSMLYRYVPDFAWLGSIQNSDENPPPILSPYVITPAPAVPSQPPTPLYPPTSPAPQDPSNYVNLYQADGSTMREAIYETISAAWTIALAAIAGFAAAYICAQLTQPTSESR